MHYRMEGGGKRARGDGKTKNGMNTEKGRCDDIRGERREGRENGGEREGGTRKRRQQEKGQRHRADATEFYTTTMTSKAQQSALDNVLVAPENQRVIGKCNMRINSGMKLKESTYQVVLDALALTTCYHAFLITAEILVIYMHQFWATIDKHKASYRFKTDNKSSQSTNDFGEMYYKKNLDFVALIWEDLAYQIDNKDSKKQEKMFYPRFTKIIIHHFLEKDKSISMRNRTFLHTAWDDNLMGTMRFVSRHEDA
ncbi:hypothetical protein Tco_0797196 [Tanacetum coccineum]